MKKEKVQFTLTLNMTYDPKADAGQVRSRVLKEFRSDLLSFEGWANDYRFRVSKVSAATKTK